MRISSLTSTTELNGNFHRKIENAKAVIKSMIDEIKEYGIENQYSNISQNSIQLLKNILPKFHTFARQLHNRHANRSPFKINDEYDVQDLLHAILKLHFEDIRPEEWTPSYAGGSARADFLIKEENIIIEVKMARDSMTTKQLGEQLIIDIEKYKNYSDLKTLILFIYDPDVKIKNSNGIKGDLEKKFSKF